MVPLMSFLARQRRHVFKGGVRDYLLEEYEYMVQASASWHRVLTSTGNHLDLRLPNNREQRDSSTQMFIDSRRVMPDLDNPVHFHSGQMNRLIILLSGYW